MTKLTHYLPFVGAIPFVLCAAGLAFGIKSVPVIGSIEKILLIYALVIASFMAGVHWGQHLSLEGRWARAPNSVKYHCCVSLAGLSRPQPASYAGLVKRGFCGSFMD